MRRAGGEGAGLLWDEVLERGVGVREERGAEGVEVGRGMGWGMMGARREGERIRGESRPGAEDEES